MLATGKSYKRGDLKTDISKEDVELPDALEASVWAELETRSKLFGNGWPLKLDGARLTRRLGAANVDFYFYMCLLGLDNSGAEDEKLFEILVRDILGGVLTGSMHIGAPASDGMDPSFRSRFDGYVRESGMHEWERGVDPLPHDQDMGVDVVGWWASADGRGGDLHYLVQCAVGGNWKSKLSDIRFEKWKFHVIWAVPPIRVFSVPRTLTMPPANWVRTTGEGGYILDRPRLMSIARAASLADTSIQVTGRILALSSS